MASPRRTALEILLRIDLEQGFSNLVLDSGIERAGLDGRDNAFVTALVYGVLEKLICLDYMIARFSGRGTDKLQPRVLNIIRLGAYQLMFMERVPAHAAVDESVKLARSAGCGYASGLVNAVLRALAASLQSLPYPDKSAGAAFCLSVRYSCPEWLVEKWLKAYGEATTLGLLESLDTRPPHAARVNTLKTTPEALVEILKSEGTAAKVTGFADAAVELEDLPDLRALKAFADGLFILQDYASQLCCAAVGARPGETVFDMCAAPGGKSFTLGFMMEGRGRITACELHRSRLALIEEGAKRLGLETLIHVVCNDSSKENESLGLADRVLCDVPCSGLGVIRRKPEIRYKKQETFDLLPDLQYIILCEGAMHVAPGGRLVYSTCTLNPDENEAVAQRFLRENPSFCPEPLEQVFFKGGASPNHFVTLFPHTDGTDGFFIARFRKSRQVADEQ